MKGEVGIEELVAISVGDIPSSNVPEMSKTPLKQNHSEQAFSFSVLYALKASIQIKNKNKRHRTGLPRHCLWSPPHNPVSSCPLPYRKHTFLFSLSKQSQARNRNRYEIILVLCAVETKDQWWVSSTITSSPEPGAHWFSLTDWLASSGDLSVSRSPELHHRSIPSQGHPTISSFLHGS